MLWHDVAAGSCSGQTGMPACPGLKLHPWVEKAGRPSIRKLAMEAGQTDSLWIIWSAASSGSMPGQENEHRNEHTHADTFIWCTCSIFFPARAFIENKNALYAGLMPFIQPSMMVLGWSRFWGDTSICHIPSPSLCMVERFTGRTGGPTLWPRQTSGREATSLWSRELTPSLLTSRSTIHPDSLRVRSTHIRSKCQHSYRSN